MGIRGIMLTLLSAWREYTPMAAQASSRRWCAAASNVEGSFLGKLTAV